MYEVLKSDICWQKKSHQIQAPSIFLLDFSFSRLPSLQKDSYILQNINQNFLVEKHLFT